MTTKRTNTPAPKSRQVHSACATFLAGAAVAVLFSACDAPVSSDGAEMAKTVDVDVEVQAEATQAKVQAEATLAVAEGAEASTAARPRTRIRIVGNGAVAVDGAIDLQPLVYVDGVRVDRGAATGTDDVLAALDPSTIARVEVLKGPAAKELYGEEASNGVIQIFLNEEEDAEGIREALGAVLSGIGEGISRTGEGIKKAGERIRKK